MPNRSRPFTRAILASVATGNGPYDEKRLRPRRDRVGQWGIRRLMGKILLARVEPQEWSALLHEEKRGRS